ncbi:sensor histidine kinase [Pedobacter nanyangensis]|uniref:sensor histidine kinase n=1 Tax=Pedobacter nanyangensis TaxID=1562389 RepID=UPI000DE49636|nr:HAMP domain-containing sensor histidine kinase [Pedobacter nanyangensis]
MSKPLLQRNTNLLLIWLPVILLACSGVFYVMLRKHAHHAEEKYLLLKQKNIWSKFISTSGTLEKQIIGEYDIIESASSISVPLDIPRDTILSFKDRNTTLPFQVLTSRFHWKDRAYLVSTYISSTETSHLIIKVFTTEAIILLVLLVAIIILSRKSSNRLWRPFSISIDAAENFDVIRNARLQLSEQTGTTEFDRLNTTLNKLTVRVNKAYFQQKHFVENASHEIQTPLAIIRAKLELLINQPNITEKEATLLGDISNATNRLSEMNRTLLLLAKIENNQFPDTEPVNVSEIVQKISASCMDYFDECPPIETFIEEEINVTANRSLVEILISNLIYNAIVHNNDEKKVAITIKSGVLKIENTGEPLLVATTELFERFKKNSHQKKTTGLGLALVKQISQLYQYNVTYNYKNGWHTVEISFG